MQCLTAGERGATSHGKLGVIEMSWCERHSEMEHLFRYEPV